VTFLEKGWPLNRKPEGVDHEDFCDPVLRRLCIDINIRHAGVWTMNNLPASAAIPLRIPIPQLACHAENPYQFPGGKPAESFDFWVAAVSMQKTTDFCMVCCDGLRRGQWENTMRIKRVAIYARVSTDGQTTDNQVIALREIAGRRGWEIVEVYTDQGISGAKGRDGRPDFDRMLKDANRRRFDVVMAWAIDRMGRSLRDLIDTIEHLEAVGVDLYLDQQSIDTTTPAGKLLFQVTGAFAEFERSMIRQRVNAGLARARAQGKRLGRPRIDQKTEQAIREALASGTVGMLKIAAAFSVGSGTVQRVKAEMQRAG
jgi:DNA invertase Pin-like site-specific DNA recombinase